jgi:uroporphyrinogen-III synthase
VTAPRERDTPMHPCPMHPRPMRVCPMRVWVTRPDEDAAALATVLRARDIAVVVEPLLRIEFVHGPPLDLAGVQALLATSANGIRAFARRNSERDLSVLAVGDATARIARSVGFTKVDSADGDVAALADLIGETLDPSAGSLLHVAAGALAGDLAGMLASRGFGYRREILYAARVAERLSERLSAQLAAGTIDAVVVFSPRTARTLVRLLDAANLMPAAAGMTCFCLSAAVADAAGIAPWVRVKIAAQPTQSSLIDAIVDARAGDFAQSWLDSVSPTGYFTGSLAENTANPPTGDGGMSGETNKDQRPDMATPQAPDSVTGSPETDRQESDATSEARPVTAEAKTSAEPWGPGKTRSEATVATAPPSGPAQTSAPPPPRSGGGGHFLWALIVLVIVAGAAAGAWFGYFQPRWQQLTAVQPTDVRQEFSGALERLESRQTAIRQQIDGISPRIDALERSITALKQSIAAIEGQETGGSQAQVELKELTDRIALLEAQAATASELAQQVRSLQAITVVAQDTASKLATTVVAVGQLSRAVGDGAPFIRELAAVKALGGDDADIAEVAAALQPYAASGIPTIAELRSTFPETANAIVAAQPVTEGNAWTDKVIDRLASLVTVRRTGPGAIAAGGVDGIVAQAETALASGDLPSAIGALETLTGAPAQAANAWLGRARARVSAEQAMATLQQRAIARLSAARG